MSLIDERAVPNDGFIADTEQGDSGGEGFGQIGHRVFTLCSAIAERCADEAAFRTHMNSFEKTFGARFQWTSWRSTRHVERLKIFLAEDEDDDAEERGSSDYIGERGDRSSSR